MTTTTTAVSAAVVATTTAAAAAAAAASATTIKFLHGQTCHVAIFKVIKYDVAILKQYKSDVCYSRCLGTKRVGILHQLSPGQY